MKNILLFTLIFTSTFSFAQNFEKKVITYANDWVEPKIIDLDNDGLDDIISVSLDGNVAWWKKNSDFTFSKILLLQEEKLWQDFDIFDMDNDGDLDILLTDRFRFYVYHNDGNQSFSQDYFNFNYNSSNIIAGDFDGDGFSDFITTQYYVGDIRFWKNISNTSYQDNNIGQTSTYTGDALADDIDDDGDLDLIIFPVPGYGDSPKIYLNDGNANFTELQINYPYGCKDIQILDFDNDGDKDIAGIRGGWTVLFTNDGNLNFTNSFLTDNNNNYYEYGAMKIVDYDDDGDYDISVLFNKNFSIFTDNFFGIYINDGNNNFTLNALEYLREGESINYFDYNSDGLTDFLATSSTFDDPRIYDNQGNGTFNTIILDDVLKYLSDRDSNDIDSDGLIDIVTTSDEEFELVLWHNMGDLNFNKIIIESSEPLMNCASVIDVNNDGNKDIISGFNTDFGFFGGINLYTNDGNLNFTESSLINNTYSINEIYTLDLNNDSYVDILTLDYYKQLIYYLNDGTGGFQAGQLVGITELIKIPHIDYVDIDNDNYKDLITGEDYYFKNDGSMNFTNTALPASGNIYDLDNDGDYDILSAKIETTPTTYESTIVWYENDGSGNYTEHEIDNSDYNKFTVDDFDGDGDIDFVAGHSASISTNDSTLSFYVNDGNQSFTKEDMDFYSYGTSYLTSNDYDGDGDIDILSSNVISKFIIWKNKSDVSLSSYQTIKKDFYKLYPNPVSDYLNITPLSDLKSIEIFDITGKKIVSLEEWNLSHIDVSVLSAGIYYLIVQDINNIKHNLKFIKE